MGTQYTFYDYVNAQGENEVLHWLNSAAGKSGKNQVKFKAKYLERLTGLEATAAADWDRPPAATLFNNCAGLYEVRVLFRKVQYRLIGFHDPGHRTGTLIFGAKEVNNEFAPNNTCQQAQAIKQIVESDPSRFRRMHAW